MSIQRDGNTLYELNEQGTNIWWATVQSPPEKSGGCAKRAEEIAHKMQYVEELESVVKVLLDSVIPAQALNTLDTTMLVDGDTCDNVISILEKMESTND